MKTYKLLILVLCLSSCSSQKHVLHTNFNWDDYNLQGPVKSLKTFLNTGKPLSELTFSRSGKLINAKFYNPKTQINYSYINKKISKIETVLIYKNQEYPSRELFNYNSKGQLIKKQSIAADNHHSNTIHYVYKNNRVIANYRIRNKDTLNCKTFLYTKNTRIEKNCHNDFKTIYTFDNSDIIKKETTKNNEVISYQYTKNGDVKTISYYSNNTLSHQINNTFIYDTYQNWISQQSSSKETTTTTTREITYY